MAEFVTDEEVKRINELYKKAKNEGLSKAEAEEQRELRKKYILAVKASLHATLNNVDIKEADGSITHLRDLKKNEF
ncbi:MAG: DUF896 domain-containing protein [Lachnospiraceae bacterium]|nr:DUF896 domain-containing protein [Lachnospiraceae bacterium]